MKTEPSEYSIDDLKADKQEMWDGVRNYQARNFMRDEMKIGDKVLFYHSNAKPAGVAGIAQVCSEPDPDPTQFDKKDSHYDPKSDPETPRWILVDVCFEAKLKRIVSLHELKENSFFDDMLVIKRGMRLSIQPVEKKHFDRIVQLSREKSIKNR